MAISSHSDEILYFDSPTSFKIHRSDKFIILSTVLQYLSLRCLDAWGLVGYITTGLGCSAALLGGSLGLNSGSHALAGVGDVTVGEL